mmetsp:Transcript_3602/g.7963  ORF Transcript_3602/g.7963 Transcript_3602/m.7963 type:complete len:202 (+) Transcript_3602:1264-1869(+)
MKRVFHFILFHDIIITENIAFLNAVQAMMMQAGVNAGVNAVNARVNAVNAGVNAAADIRRLGHHDESGRGEALYIVINGMCARAGRRGDIMLFNRRDVNKTAAVSILVIESVRVLLFHIRLLFLPLLVSFTPFLRAVGGQMLPEIANARGDALLAGTARLFISVVIIAWMLIFSQNALGSRGRMRINGCSTTFGIDGFAAV